MRIANLRKLETLTISLTLLVLVAGCASTPVSTGTVGPPFTGETFLPNYSELKPVPTKDGTDYIYLAPHLEDLLAKYRNGIMLDQPEVFISPHSPYTGAKPADIEGIAEFIRGRVADQIKARGYKIVDQKGPGVIYARIALTNLELQKKSRNILAYTPVGFVISTAVRAVQDFLEKMDILKFAFQAEFLDAQTGQQLAAGVVPRGGDGTKMTYSQFEALVDEYGARMACRLDNSRVPEAKRIDCSDPAARKARPPLPSN